TLDARCGDLCKPQARLSAQWHAFWQALLPRAAWPWLQHGAAQALLAMSLLLPLALGLMLMLYQHEWSASVAVADPASAALLEALLRSALSKAALFLVLGLGIAVWWGVLALQSRSVAREESQRQTEALMQEIASHRRTDAALQQARQEAEQARAAAEAANQAKSRYVSSLSHELRTPLNSLLGYAQLIGEEPGLPPRRRQAVQVIQRSGEHLLTLIDASLDLARIEAGRLVLARKPFRLDLLLDEVADMVRLQAASRGLAFHYEPPALPEWVRGDARRLRQILLNLLGNAVKFTLQGEVCLQVQHGRDLATLCVLDSGPGLPDGALEHIFEPFDRGAGSEAPGAGLGLTIARMLAQLMGGDLQAANRPEGGAAFTLRLHLPVLSPEAVAALECTPESAPEAVSGEGQLVLLVDNEAADRQLLRDLLEPLGFEVREAASGHDALDLLATGLRPTALLVDLAMPGIDGWETLRRAQSLWGPTPLPPHAIVSANAFEKDQPRPPGVPEGAFFTKPVRHAELLAWLGRQLAPPVLPAPASAGSDPLGPGKETPRPAAAAAPDAARHAEALASLQQSLDLGYARGVQEALAELEQAGCWIAERLAPLQTLAAGLQLSAVRAQLQAQLRAQLAQAGTQDLTLTGDASPRMPDRPFPPLRRWRPSSRPGAGANSCSSS
ncbi:MAG TPA: ATP-binding protein, partial [Burkholderiaceae bacterium]|nr:ATP-binding protein [Burkholderiaceae bacterium]